MADTRSEPSTPPDPLSGHSPAGAQGHYDRLLPEARALPESDVRVARVDVPIILANARAGAAAVLAHADRIRAELPGVSVARIEALADLGAALAFAAGQVERYAPPPTDARRLLNRAYELRAMLLTGADLLAMAGVIPSASVQKIRQGRGGFDTAGDCVALAALFREHAGRTAGTLPFGGDAVDEAADVGTRLLAVLRPKGAGQPTDAALAEASDARDRLWTLFERTWEQDVWRAGAWLFGRDVDEHVPALQSRVVSRPAEG